MPDTPPKPPIEQPAERSWLRRSRVFWVAWIVLTAVLTGVGIERALHGSTDFDGFYWSARPLAGGKAPGDQERYPPSFQLLLLPLAVLPYPVAAVVWCGLSAACLLAMPRVLRRLSGLDVPDQVLPWVTVLPFVWANLVLGQSGPLLLVLVCLGVAMMARGRGAAGGFLVGTAALLKVFPALFLALSPVLGQMRRAALGMAAAVALVTIGLTLCVGPRGVKADVASWLENLQEKESAFALLNGGSGPPHRYNNQALAMTLLRTWCDLETDPQHGAVRLARWPKSAGLALYVALVAAVVAGWALAAVRAWRRPSPGDACGLVGLTALVALTLSPLVWTHYFIWWLPAVVFLAGRKRFLIVLAAASVVGLTIPALRALGVHMGLSLVLYGVVLHDLLRRPAEAREPRADPTAGT